MGWGKRGINFLLRSDATILTAWLLIHDTGRFLPISASLPATLEESFTSLARMETSPFSTGFHNHHPEGNLNNAAMLQPIATRTQVLELGPRDRSLHWSVLVRPGPSWSRLVWMSYLISLDPLLFKNIA